MIEKNDHSQCLVSPGDQCFLFAGGYQNVTVFGLECNVLRYDFFSLSVMLKLNYVIIQNSRPRYSIPQ